MQALPKLLPDSWIGHKYFEATASEIPERSWNEFNAAYSWVKPLRQVLDAFIWIFGIGFTLVGLLLPLWGSASLRGAEPFTTDGIFGLLPVTRDAIHYWSARHLTARGDVYACGILSIIAGSFVLSLPQFWVALVCAQPLSKLILIAYSLNPHLAKNRRVKIARTLALLGLILVCTLPFVMLVLDGGFGDVLARSRKNFLIDPRRSPIAPLITAGCCFILYRLLLIVPAIMIFVFDSSAADASIAHSKLPPGSADAEVAAARAERRHAASKPEHATTLP